MIRAIFGIIIALAGVFWYSYLKSKPLKLSNQPNDTETSPLIPDSRNKDNLI